MSPKPPQPENYVQYHKDGSLYVKGSLLSGVPTGYWEFFRKDGTLMRSGYFDNGEQTGKWVTYDRQGKPFKETMIDPKKNKPSTKGKK